MTQYDTCSRSFITSIISFQGLAGAIHNVDRGHAPVLIYAGAAPQSSDGRIKGTKNEWPMWLQGVLLAFSINRSLPDREPQISLISRLSSVNT